MRNYRSIVSRLLRQGIALLIVLLLAAPAPAAEKKPPQPEKIGKGLNFFSQEQEVSMGRSYSEQLGKDLQLIDDPNITQYVENIGQRLVQVSMRRDLEYHFFVVNTQEVNAFALPGGYVYVNRGLIEKADSEPELAGVLGHEIGHVVGKHSIKQMSKKLLLVGITLGVGLAVTSKSKKWGEAVTLIGGIGTFFATLKYSRDDEREADWLALNEMSQAGYSPWGMVTFFEKLEAMSKGAGGMPAFLSTHPLPAERKANMRRQIADLGLRRQEEAPYSAGFAQCRQRLAAVSLPPAGREKTLSNALAALVTKQGTSPGGEDKEPTRPARPSSVVRTITVAGDAVWVDTGIDLFDNDLIEVQAGGRVNWKKNSEEACGPDGVPGKGFWKPLSNSPTAALIGRIGQDSTGYFMIGSQFSGRCERAGRLYLGINDDNNFDNRGAFEVQIHVGP